MALPESKASASMTIAGVTLELHVLDDGQRVIGKDGFDALFAKMQSGSLSAQDALRAAAWVKRALAN